MTLVRTVCPPAPQLGHGLRGADFQNGAIRKPVPLTHHGAFDCDLWSLCELETTFQSRDALLHRNKSSCLRILLATKVFHLCALLLHRLLLAGEARVRVGSKALDKRRHLSIRLRPMLLKQLTDEVLGGHSRWRQRGVSTSWR